MAKTTEPQQPEAKKRPTISILERRAQGIGVHGDGSPTIDLKEPGFTVRWFNSDVAADHIWRAQNRKGWEKVTPAELADPEQVGGFQVSPDGFVVRGERGRELLLKMPTQYRTEIEKRKAEQNIRDMDPHRQKAQVAEAAGKSLGDQAGSFINENVSLVGSIKTTRERIAVTPEVQ
jgi:hypothetical protein